MRFTAVQRIINAEREFALKIQCVLPAFLMRLQREFDKCKNVGGRVAGKKNEIENYGYVIYVC